MANWVYKRTAACAEAAVGYCSSSTSQLVGDIPSGGTLVELACVSDAGVLQWRKSILTQFAFISDLVIVGSPNSSHFYIAYRDDDVVTNWMLVKINAGDGTIVWQAKGSEADEVRPYGIVFDASYNPIIVGDLIGASNRYIWAVKFPVAGGTPLYSKNYEYTVTDYMGLAKGGVTADSSYVRIAARRTATSLFLLTLNKSDLSFTAAGTYTTATSADYPPSIVNMAYAGAPAISWGASLMEVSGTKLRPIFSGQRNRLFAVGSGASDPLMVVHPQSASQTDVLKVNIASGAYSSVDTSPIGFSGSSGTLAVNPADAIATSTKVLSAIFASVGGEVWAAHSPLTYSAANDGTYSGLTHGAGTAPTPNSTFTTPTWASYTITTTTGTVTASTPTTETSVADTFSYSLDPVPAPPSTTGTLDGVLHALTADLSRTDKTLAATLPALRGLLGDIQNTAAGVLPAVQGTLTGMNNTLGASLPAITASLNLVTTVFGEVNGYLPHVVSSITAERAEAVRVDGALPLLTAAIEGTVGSIGQITAALPTVAASLAGGTQQNAFVLPTLTAHIQGVVGLVATMAATLPEPTAALEGKVATLGEVGGTLTRIQANVAAITGVIGAITGKVPTLAGVVEGGIGNTGTMHAALPAVVASSSGSAAIGGSITAILPGVIGRFDLTYAPTHELTQVMNTISSAVTIFDNYAYNSFAFFGGQYIGAGDSGALLLDNGDKDNLADINATMKTGQIDFGSSNLKRMSDFYLAMRTKGDIALQVSTDEMGAFSYTLKPHDVETLKQRKDLIGKGMRGRYWQFEMSNTAGCDFDFDAYNMLIYDMSRRV